MSAVTIEIALVPAVGPVGGRVASVLAGPWQNAVIVSPLLVKHPAMRRQLETLETAFGVGAGAPVEIAAADGARLSLLADVDAAVERIDDDTDLLVLDLIGADLPSRSPVVLGSLLSRLHPGATALLAVTSGWLQQSRFERQRAELLAQAALRTVVDIGSPAAAKSDMRLPRDLTPVHGVPVSLLHLVRDASNGPTYFVSAPAASSSAAPAVERFLDALRSEPATDNVRSEWGFATQVDSTRWDPGWLRPERQALLEQLAEDRGVVAIRDIGTLLRGRRPPRDADVGPEVTIIQAKDVTRGLPAVEDLASWPSGGRFDRLTRVQAGDVIGSISGPSGRWAVVPDSYGDVYAGDHTVVIRIDPAVPMSPAYLAAWLSSTAAQPLFAARGAVIQRLDLHELEGMPIPTVDGTIAASEQIARVNEAIELLTARLKDLEAARAGFFDGLRSQRIGRRIAEVADNASTTIAGLVRHQDLLRRVQDLYPYPIARNVRALRLAQHPRTRYDEILNSFESLMLYVAMLALGWASRAGIVTNEANEWQTKVHQGGASLGTALAAARSIGRAAMAADSDVAFAPALAATGRASLSAALGELVTERNSVHGNRPQSDAAYQARVEATLPKLELALEASAFLVRDDLLWVRNVRPLERPGGPVFEVTAERSMGDHPDWDVETFLVPSLVFDQRFYVRSADTERMVDVSPFLLVLQCSECQQRHLYCPDKIKPSAAVLNSLDRGHQREDSDPGLRKSLATAIPKP